MPGKNSLTGDIFIRNKKWTPKSSFYLSYTEKEVPETNGFKD